MYQTGRDASLPLALLLSFNVGDTTCHLPRLRRARDIIFVTLEDVMDLMSASHVCIACLHRICCFNLHTATDGHSDAWVSNAAPLAESSWGSGSICSIHDRSTMPSCWVKCHFQPLQPSYPYQWRAHRQSPLEASQRPQQFIYLWYVPCSWLTHFISW